MPGTPHLGVSIDFASGPSFGNPLILGDISTPLGTGVLADAPSDVVDISDITLQVSVRRGRNRILDKFEAGNATVVLDDTTGAWNPSNTGSPYYGKLVPLRKIRIWADYDNGSGTQRYYLFSGYITSYDTSFAVGVDGVSRVALKCIDGFRLLNNTAISTVPGTSAGQLSGARINNLLDVASWPSSLRAIDNGSSTLQADSGADRDLLSAIQVCEISDFGGFFIDTQGAATFYSRDTVSKKADVTPTIYSDTGAGISYQGIDFAFDDTLLVNDVFVSRANGGTANIYDQTSIDTYFIHSGKRENILVQTDAEAQDQATMILQARKDANLRIDSMTLNLFDASQPSRITAGLSSEIFDLVNITKTVPGGSTVTRELFVQGIQTDATPRSWNTTLLTSEPIIQAFILDSTTDQGKLGSGILSY